MDESNSPGPVDASEMTSRSAFRVLAKGIGATNREADTLRRSLLAQWEEHSRVHLLAQQLQKIDAESTEAQLAAWFTFTDAADRRLVDAGDPLLSGLSAELQTNLTAITRQPVSDTD